MPFINLVLKLETTDFQSLKTRILMSLVVGTSVLQYFILPPFPYIACPTKWKGSHMSKLKVWMPRLYMDFLSFLVDIFIEIIGSLLTLAKEKNYMLWQGMDLRKKGAFETYALRYGNICCGYNTFETCGFKHAITFVWL